MSKDNNTAKIIALTNAANSALKNGLSAKLDKPTTAGTSGQVLLSDGNGGQAWGTPGTGTITVDTSLSVAGSAADAAKTGELKNAISHIPVTGMKFTIPASTAHSSSKDQVSVDIKTGKKYRVIKSTGTIYAFYSDGTNGSINETGTASKDIIAIGIYKNNTESSPLDVEFYVVYNNAIADFYDTLEKAKVIDYTDNTIKHYGLLSIKGSNKKNLFDVTSEGTSLGGYYNRSNSYTSDSSLGQSDYVFVQPHMKIVTPELSVMFTLWYDSSKTFIGYSEYTSAGYIMPIEGASYGKFGFAMSRISSFYITCDEAMEFDAEPLTGLYQYYNPLNKFDKNSDNNILNGYYSDGTTFNSSTTLGQSELIEVEPTGYYKQSDVGFFVLWYKSDQSYGGKLSSNNSGQFNMPATAKYARFIFYLSHLSEFTVYQTDSNYTPLKSPSAPFNFPVNEVINARDSFDNLNNRLNYIEALAEGASDYTGLNGVAFGTSLTYRAQTTGGYLQYLPTMLGMTFVNQGIGSSVILGDGGSLDMLANIKAYNSYSGKRVYIIEGFVNDWYQNNTLGTWKDSNETTVCGCVRSAINYIMSQNANMTIFIVLDPCGRNYSGTNCSTTATNSSSLTQYEYYEEISKVAESLGIPVIKGYAISGISENTPQYLMDNIHPTELGAKQMANVIYSQMRKYIPNEVST